MHHSVNIDTRRPRQKSVQFRSDLLYPNPIMECFKQRSKIVISYSFLFRSHGEYDEPV